MTVLASGAFAQSDDAPGAAISLTGGAGSTSAATGVALGGSALLDMTDWTALEVQGAYLDRGAGADAVHAGASLLVNFVPVRARVVPYAAVGAGVYRASFDLADPRFFGPVGTQFPPDARVCPAPGTGIGFGPGMGFGPGTAECPADAAGYRGVGQMSRFYARRMGPMVVPAAGHWQTRSFTDPAMTFGGGLRFNVNERLMIRPDVRALTVFASGDTHTLLVYNVSIGYRF